MGFAVRALPILLASFFLLGRVGTAQFSPMASTIIAEGDSLYAAFNNKKALQMYLKAFTQDSSFDVRLRLSRTYYDYGLDLLAKNDEPDAKLHFEQSVLHAQHLVHAFPDSAQSHFMLAATIGNLAQFESGQKKVVIGRMVEQHSRQAIALDSTWAYPYVSLGIYFRELSRLSWLERAMAKVFYGRIPNVKESDVLSLLLRAIEIKPDFAFLHHELAMTYLTFGQKQKAMDHLETLILLAPETSQDVRNQVNARALMEEMREQP